MPLSQKGVACGRGFGRVASGPAGAGSFAEGAPPGASAAGAPFAVGNEGLGRLSGDMLSTGVEHGGGWASAPLGPGVGELPAGAGSLPSAGASVAGVTGSPWRAAVAGAAACATRGGSERTYSSQSGLSKCRPGSRTLSLRVSARSSPGTEVQSAAVRPALVTASASPCRRPSTADGRATPGLFAAAVGRGVGCAAFAGAFGGGFGVSCNNTMGTWPPAALAALPAFAGAFGGGCGGGSFGGTFGGAVAGARVDVVGGTAVAGFDACFGGGSGCRGGWTSAEAAAGLVNAPAVGSADRAVLPGGGWRGGCGKWRGTLGAPIGSAVPVARCGAAVVPGRPRLCTSCDMAAAETYWQPQCCGSVHPHHQCPGAIGGPMRTTRCTTGAGRPSIGTSSVGGCCAAMGRTSHIPSSAGVECAFAMAALG